ncbi:hypothetical protein SAMN05444396_104190 [Flavobacterium segetis]|uniref:GTP-binding protein n=1 Tax=Flavobacterium segetis TaxID=271157 RepID=A0A1M5GVS4_9FLAO|nr:hypothetical protein [Flavobacterium segetis]SHG07829.1 hypothetical protein SAMN05444396_104190 [Flavobacterium segetis]
MDANKEIRLRLRFYKDVMINTTVLSQKFAIYAKSNPQDYFIKTRGTHIWINIIGSEKRYYSPHLHLELEAKSENETHIRGLFGPDPTLWTLFMFLHFVIAGIFLIFTGIAYSNSVLNKSYTSDFVVLTLMVLSWFLLYFIAKQIRSNGNDQTHELEKVFFKILES